jgi:hypothetical protein
MAIGKYAATDIAVVHWHKLLRWAARFKEIWNPARWRYRFLFHLLLLLKCVLPKILPTCCPQDSGFTHADCRWGTLELDCKRRSTRNKFKTTLETMHSPNQEYIDIRPKAIWANTAARPWKCAPTPQADSYTNISPDISPYLFELLSAPGLKRVETQMWVFKRLIRIPIVLVLWYDGFVERTMDNFCSCTHLAAASTHWVVFSSLSGHTMTLISK